MKKLIIGVDNGVTGSWGVISSDFTDFFVVPTFKHRKYTKKAQNVSRIDLKELSKRLAKYKEICQTSEMIAVLERPMINPQRFQASTSALRAWEATLIFFEQNDIEYVYIDSKEWQKKMFNLGGIGSKELKESSLAIGNKLFPEYENHKHKDRDGLLIASYYYTFLNKKEIFG